jgi:ABC-type Fe3+-siderophore transport system permease subunit
MPNELYILIGVIVNAVSQVIIAWLLYKSKRQLEDIAKATNGKLEKGK